MKLKIRYDNEYQTIVLNDKDTQQLWMSLSLEGDDLTQKEKEELIQDAWEKKYNRPEYNNWHKFDRHRGYSKAQPGKDDAEDDIDISEPLLDKVADSRIFYKDELERKDKEDYEEICRWVRKTLANKPEWAEAFIAVHMDGENIRDYARRTGENENNISQKLKRSVKKLKENF